MTKFIMVHECAPNDQNGKRTLIINVDCIEHVTIGNKGKDSYIKLRGAAGFFFVREALDEIYKHLSTDNTEPPVVMTAEEYSYYKNGA